MSMPVCMKPTPKSARGGGRSAPPRSTEDGATAAAGAAADGPSRTFPLRLVRLPTDPQTLRARTMKIQPFVVTPKDYARSLDVVGEKITVLASKTATQGYEIFRQEGDEGTGPSPHSHDWDESFYVVNGTVEISHLDRTITATPGTLVHLPAGTVHSFRFGAGGGQMVSVTGQSGLASQLFTDIDKEIPPGPPDIAKLIEVGQRNGVTVAV